MKRCITQPIKPALVLKIYLMILDQSVSAVSNHPSLMKIPRNVTSVQMEKFTTSSSINARNVQMQLLLRKTENVFLVLKKLSMTQFPSSASNVLMIMFMMLTKRSAFLNLRKFQHHQSLSVSMEKNTTMQLRNVNVQKTNLSSLATNASSVMSPLSSTLTSRDVRNVEMAMFMMLTTRSVRNVHQTNQLRTTVNVKPVLMVPITVKKPLYVFNVEMAAPTTIL